MKNSVFLLCTLLAFLSFGCLNGMNDTSSQTTSQDPQKEQNSGFAPASLARGYIFSKTPDGKSAVYWIWTATQGFALESFNYAGNRISTSYTYIKTGRNTATFKYEIDEYNANAVTPYRHWVRSGALTYTSATECDFVYTETYQGAPNGGGTMKLYVCIDPSLVYLPN